MSLGKCCVTGFKWDGTPEGRVVEFPTSSNQAYVTGSNKDAAVLMVHDGFGWEFVNNRLLADHLAKEADVTVYIPDFFNGESLPSDILADPTQKRWAEIDLWGFINKNSREIREPEIFACAKKLRAEYKKVGTIGHCYGGWAVLRLGSTDFVDCLIACHPSLLTAEDIDGVKVPVQFQAPEIDGMFTDELKLHSFTTLQKRKVAFDYQHFPNLEHGCLTRGNETVPGEREAMVRGKNAAVFWFKQWLH